MRNLINLFSLVLCVALGATVAQATTLTDISGEVRLNSGDGFKVVSGTVAVKPGDIVITGPKASARIVYSAAYAIDVNPGRIKTVADNAKQAKRLAQLRSTAMRQSAGGAPAGVPGPQCLPGIPLSTCLVGAGAVAIGAGIAIIASNNKDDKPVSN